MSSRKEERKTMVWRVDEVTVVTCDNCGEEVELANPEFGIRGLNDWGYICAAKDTDLCPVCLAKVEAVLEDG